MTLPTTSNVDLSATASTKDSTEPETRNRPTMMAITQDTYGAPLDVLELNEVAMPAIGDDDVLVRVRAAGVHIGDWLVGSGLPYMIRLGYGLRKPKNRVPGMEVAGYVEAVGSSVQRFHPGDEVFGWCTGAFAEYASVSQDALVLKPANATFEQAAAVPISGFTAIQAVRDVGRVLPGDKVLVIGASGGVGTYAVQIAKAFGAEVTGVCSTRNMDMVRAIGADHVIDYTSEGITDAGRHYDVVLDMAGNRPLSELRRALTPDGTLVIVGGSGGPMLMGFGRTIRALAAAPFVSQNIRQFLSATTQEDLIALSELIEAGTVSPAIDRTFDLCEAAEAIAYVGERHTQGKTVITV